MQVKMHQITIKKFWKMPHNDINGVRYIKQGVHKKLRFGVLNDKQDLIFNFNLGGKVQDSFANQNSRNL